MKPNTAITGNKNLYLIRELKLKGATFNLYTHIHLSNDATFTYKENRLIMVTDNGQRWENNNYYKLSEKPIGYNMEENSYLPYFAKVTEDIPNSYKGLEPKVYERCQLTTQYPNNYLVFEDVKTKKELKIAMNSHTYEPIN